MNPTNNNTAVRMKAESALAAFIRNFYDVRAEDPAFDKSQLDVLCRRPGSPIDGLPIYEGQTPLGFTLPCIVVNVTSCRNMIPDVTSYWAEVTPEIHVMTQLEEGNEGTENEGETNGTALNNAAGEHAERVGFTVDLLADENQVMTKLNKQSEPDERPVKSFHALGYWKEGEQSTQMDLHWDDVLSYTFHCAPIDVDNEAN